MNVTMHHRWRLAHQPSAAGVARGHMATVCGEMDRGLYETALLLTSELVTNAVQHTRGAIELFVALSGECLRVEVRDEAPGHPMPPLELAAMATGGRGLMLVDRLAESWGVHAKTTASGKSVWFELTLAPEDPVAIPGA